MAGQASAHICVACVDESLVLAFRCAVFQSASGFRQNTAESLRHTEKKHQDEEEDEEAEHLGNKVVDGQVITSQVVQICADSPRSRCRHLTHRASLLTSKP